MVIRIANVCNGNWWLPCARRQDASSILIIVYLFISASFQKLSPLPLWERARVRVKNKKPFIPIRDEEFSFDYAQDRSPRYHPNSLVSLIVS